MQTRIFGPAALVLIALTSGVFAQSPANSGLKFESDIRPIFRAHCYDCHGATRKVKGRLDLRLVRFLRKGGESGPAIVPGKPRKSLLLQRIKAGEMPPGDKRVSAKEIAMLERWIANGAKTARPEPKTIGPGLGITPEERAWWAFQPIRRPKVVMSKANDRIRTPIDALLNAAMPRGLDFSPDADRRTLVLRLYLDLTGLPPTPAEMQSLLKERSGDWYEKLIDRLLKSPHYGERWGRHWLDVAGYADSEGYTNRDDVRPWAWKYRDYVIRAFNADKPFDRFITEQLAGDELAGPKKGEWTKRQIELLTATGFLRMAADGTGSGANNAAGRNQVMADTLKIVSTSLLGMSVACAQCHDHRYDPIPQTDYYALRAVFEPALDWKKWRTPSQRRVSLYTAADRKKAADVEAQTKKVAAEKAKRLAEYMQQALEIELKKYKQPLRDQLRKAYKTPGNKRSADQKMLLKKHPSVNITPGVLYQYIAKSRAELKKYDSRIAKIRAGKPKEEFLRSLVEPAGHSPATKLFHRGDHRQPMQVVEPGGLTVAAPEGKRAQFPAKAKKTVTSGRRTAFARWLTNGKHPLVARVIVNRVWMHHFGRGLVSTPGDFGKLGTKPTHPKLLDWLADEFMRQNWSLKKLHRVILLSTAYRQSSRRDPAKDVIDSSNRYYWRKSLMRLEAETLRDRMLAVSGTLDRKPFGPPLSIKENTSGQIVVIGEQKRRSIYIQVRRSRPVGMLRAFDLPVMETNCEKRDNSTVATQSLILLNGEFIRQQAGRLADSALKQTPGKGAKLLLPACLTTWRRVYCREPSDDERKVVAAFVKEQLQHLKQNPGRLPKGVSAEKQVVTNLCQVLMSSNEFLYVD